MSTLVQDLRFAVRRLLSSPGFTVVAVLTLALGIGANSAIFSVVDGVLLRPLPYQEPEQLATVFHFYPSYDNLEAGVAVPTYHDLREAEGPFRSVAVETWWGVNFAGAGTPERVIGSLVSGEFFATYGASAALGRTILPEDVETGRENVVVLSHGLWRRAYGGDEGVIGRTMQLDGEEYEIVGVMPRGFSEFFNQEAQLWAPAIFDPGLSNARTSEFLVMTARLRPGVGMEEAGRALARFSDELKELHPESYPEDWSLRMRSLEEQATGDVRPALLVLLGAVGFVLLIAVANLANLLLARGAGRRSEMAVRTAMGARRGRLLRQLLTESLLLALLGGACGLLLAQWATSALIAFGPADLPRLDSVSVDGRVLLFALGVSVLAGLLFGLLPALQTAESNPQAALREEGRGTGSAFGRRGIRRVVVIAEVALALVLMVGAGLMIRSFHRLQQVDPGFVAGGVVTMQTALPQAEYREGERQAAFFSEALREVRGLPGVTAAGAASTLPATGSGWTRNFVVEGYEAPASAPGPWGEFRVATPGYFDALGIRLIRGRTFTDADDAAGLPVAVVDEVLAEQYWPGENPIGKRVGLSTSDGVAWRQVVGVVGHAMSGAIEASPRTQLYFAHAQFPIPNLALAVRGAGDPTRLVPAVRDAVLRVDADQPVFNVQPMETYVAESVAQRRFLMLLLGLFAALAVTLAAVGVYGVMSYAVAQRAREMGIRMALGAAPAMVMGLVVRQAMGAVLMGVGIGVLAAFGLVRLLRSQLYDVSPSDPLTFAAAVLIFAAVALAATAVPARQAVRAGVMASLRRE